MDCDMIHDTYIITKLNVKGQKFYIKLICTDSNDKLFHIQLYDGTNAWSGVISSDCANLVDESIEEYKLNTQKCFLEPAECFVFNFSIAPCGKKACFSWLKVFEDQTEMPYGSVEVDIESEPDAKDYLIDFLIDENKKLKESIKLYDRRNKSVNDDLEKCKRKLDEFANMKNSLEANLYGKFVQVLNEKKKRIQILEDCIQKLE